jgi:hypothetical protein
MPYVVIRTGAGISIKWILPFMLLGTLAIPLESGERGLGKPAIEYENPVVRGVNPDHSNIRIGEGRRSGYRTPTR